MGKLKIHFTLRPKADFKNLISVLKQQVIKYLITTTIFLFFFLTKYEKTRRQHLKQFKTCAIKINFYFSSSLIQADV